MSNDPWCRSNATGVAGGGVSARTVLLKASFPNPNKRLWAGEFVSTQLRLFVEQGAIVVPTQAAQALDQYLQRRGVARLVDLDRPNPELTSLPLVASTLDGRETVSYSALYRSTKTWFGKATGHRA